jgi:formamidopyrimidine-DNA glycosylase
MPELPEVEAVVRAVRRAALGRRIASARVYRCAPVDLEKAVGG